MLPSVNAKQILKMANERGFTLVELLIVIMIIAAIAGGVVLSLDDTEDEAGLQISRSEIVKVKEAILKFKLDTGYLPGQGPFRLCNDGGAIPDGSVVNPSDPCNKDNLPSYVPNFPAVAQKKWFDSPANFWLLFGRDDPCPDTVPSTPVLDEKSPLCRTGHPLEAWNPNTRRGWRGPYLSRIGEGLVDVGDNLTQAGCGSPEAGTVLSQVRGVADPFDARPVNANTYFVWRTLPDDTDATTHADDPHTKWGRPYLMFDLANNKARIVGLGKNRRFDIGVEVGGICPPDGDDIVLDILK